MGKETARAAAARDGDPDALARLRARLPAERRVCLLPDDAIRDAYQEAATEDYLARTSNDEVRAKAARKALDEARYKAVEAGAVIVTFRNQGRPAWRELLDAHAPRPEDHETQKRATGNEQARARWNHDTFAPAAIAFAAADPRLTPEDIIELADDGRLSEGELTQLLNAAIDVHEGTRIADLGN